MFGAFIGDFVGSRFEFDNYRHTDFDLFDRSCFLTDDSYMTLAIMKTIVKNINHLDDEVLLKKETIKYMKEFYEIDHYAGYGGNFYRFLNEENPKPYNSFGNGSAMRISSVGWIADSVEQVKRLSCIFTEISHNHKEGIKGAECIAMCIYLLRNGIKKEELRQYVIDNYYPNIKDLDYDDLVKNYEFNETCQRTVPQALYCFFISNSFEDCLRKSISVGGDSDTLACISCSVCEAYYPIEKHIKNRIINETKEYSDIISKFDEIVQYNEYVEKLK